MTARKPKKTATDKTHRGTLTSTPKYAELVIGPWLRWIATGVSKRMAPSVAAAKAAHRI